MGFFSKITAGLIHTAAAAPTAAADALMAIPRAASHPYRPVFKNTADQLRQAKDDFLEAVEDLED